MTYKTYDGRIVYVDARLKSMPFAQCGVIFTIDGCVGLISYTTLVCTIDKNGWLECTGLYSATTRKHIGKFLREYAPNLSYPDAKYCYEHNVRMNIDTGEIADMPY